MWKIRCRNSSMYPTLWDTYSKSPAPLPLSRHCCSAMCICCITELRVGVVLKMEKGSSDLFLSRHPQYRYQAHADQQQRILFSLVGQSEYLAHLRAAQAWRHHAQSSILQGMASQAAVHLFLQIGHETIFLNVYYQFLLKSAASSSAVLPPFISYQHLFLHNPHEPQYLHQTCLEWTI